MNTSIPQVMKAAAIDRFGGPAVLKLKSLPVPRPKARDVLIRLETAGIGVWDPEVRAGDVEFGPKRKFPRIIGNDGAGTVVAVGSAVKRFKVGDRVYAYAYEGGFYAEYVAVPANDVARVPPGLSPREAGALGADGITALLGLDDTLRLKKGETVMIFGASGGIGHIAVQLAKRIGAKVLAVASEPTASPSCAGSAPTWRSMARRATSRRRSARSRRTASTRRSFWPAARARRRAADDEEGRSYGVPERRRAPAARAEGRSRARIRRHALPPGVRAPQSPDRRAAVPRRARTCLSPRRRGVRAPPGRQASRR